MTIITVNPITASAYSDLLFEMLSDFEGTKPLVYADSNGNATIGIGFELSANSAAILQGMGYTPGTPLFSNLTDAITHKSEI